MSSKGKATPLPQDDKGTEEITISLEEGNFGKKPTITVGTSDDKSVKDISARRSGSATVLVTNAQGEVSVERRQSDLSIAVKRRVSGASLPSIIPGPAPSNAPPLLNAEDALERTGGKGASGAYSEHMYPLEVLADKYHVALNFNDVTKSLGLTKSQAENLLHEYGPNVLTPPPKVPLWLLFLIQFTNVLMVLLEITALLTYILYAIQPQNLTNLYLGLLLTVAIVVTCYETFSQEAKSDALMESFRNLVPQEAMVLRDGSLSPVPAAQLVIGDVIRLKSGDKVPADCRVILCEGQKVDQSMITGEAEPVENAVVAADPHALEAKNIIFNGSLIVEGASYAMVIRTGDATLIGTMVELTGDVGKSSSTLKADIEYFVRILAIFALIQAALIFAVGLSKGLNPIDVFVNGFVVIMVGNVPQGLPSTITACLYLVAERMKEQNVLVKKLDIIETLGSCTLICTDKTGTLTMNLMSVANAWVFASRANHEEFLGEEKQKNEQYSQLAEIATLNSRVVLERKTPESPELPNGDATELGLYRFFTKYTSAKYGGTTIESYRAANPKLWEIPFNSKFKWQMSIHTLQSKQGKQFLFLKGAPDVLLGKCGFYLSSEGKYEPIDEEFKRIYTTAYEDFGGEGERVLGFAMRPLPRSFEEELAQNPKYKEHLREQLIGKDAHHAINDLIFVGLVTLQDPPRPEVPKAVKDCHTAGVKVVMVTGDHPLTAESIARKIGLITLPTKGWLARQNGIRPEEVKDDEIGAVVVHGSEIPAMTEEDWVKLISKKEIVFARTSPEQKLIIVQQFTKAGNVTAMTGDGVNDSPALKQAAIGIAMGLNGSEVAKEASDVVLLDDNFASIVVGIREGRLLFANLKKSVAYTLCHLTPEVVPVLLWGFVGCPQPMGSMLALCIDLLTELVPATSFAYEKAEGTIMLVPPRNVKTDKLTSFKLLAYAYFQAGFIETGGCLFYFFRAFQYYHVSPYALYVSNNQYFPEGDDNGKDSFTTDDGKVYGHRKQLHVLQSIYAGWYWMIVIGQVAHVFVCRTTTVSIWSHGIFDNKLTNFGAVLALALASIVVYMPGIRYVVQAQDPVHIEIFYASLLVCPTIIFWAEGRKWFTRTYPEHWLNKYLAW